MAEEGVADGPRVPPFGGGGVDAIYGSRPTRRRRRTKAALARLRDELRDVLEHDHPMTVRQVFYRLVRPRVSAKTEQEHKHSVGPHVELMSAAGSSPASE